MLWFIPPDYLTRPMIFSSSAGYLEKVPSVSQVKEVHCVSRISRLWYSKEMSLTRLTEAGRFISTSQARDTSFHERR